MPAAPILEVPVKGLIASLEDGLMHRPRNGEEWMATNGADKLYKSFSSRIVYATNSIDLSEFRERFVKELFADPNVNPVVDLRGPSVQLFERLARSLRLDPKDCVVIEATGAGAKAAKEAGVGIVIGLRTTMSPDEKLSDAHFIVEDPSRLTFADGVLTVTGATTVLPAVGRQNAPSAEPADSHSFDL